MDIHKSDFWTVIKFGNLRKFMEKLNVENKAIEEVVNAVNENGISLLEESLISRKFDIALFLLGLDANVNIISNDGYNEWHFLAANINCIGAIDVANQLIERDVDLNLKDKKIGNSAIMSLVQEVLKERTKEGFDFILQCLEKRPNFNDENKFGYSLRKIIEERGTEDLKKVMEMMS
ncbi:ankyrin repeat-containing protein [Fictibacillus macauensis ZFHKF-1]|uniref:Ankyrin repeat-containing protein n=1 Tax=Fictibacillus macauensis ZFHKF-1 TaxID=1196324 RepID=I8UKY9_9BACL|nr:ankyrin repeat domain-containing protein [Fictibacillus macauensis]EIT87458.1 ankyrin repeat-containing protein [Fictibacillus macauensis ZFHKF-1]